MIAICGTGMGALAGMLKAKGFRVTGSDSNVYPPMSVQLENQGIDVFNGYSGNNLKSKPDLVVVGNAVSRDNPEVQEMINQKMSFCSMPQAVQHFFGSSGELALITGTHGKTTTSALLSWVLYHNQYDPSFFVGGILKNFNSNSRVGQGKFLVIEGDEYDTAFFDKGPKFLHYTPSHLIVTSIEFDHADIYKDLRQIQDAFEKLLTKLPLTAYVAAYGADPIITSLISNMTNQRIETYGFDNTATWRIEDIKQQQSQTFFSVYYNNQLFGKFTSPLMGNHNLLNTLAVIGVAHDIGLSYSSINQAIQSFKGVKRRQEIRGVVNNITVMDDFAHHPTAVKETLKAVKPFYEQGRIFAVFEPRTNSSRRRVFQDIYPDSFNDADIICIPKPPLMDKIPEQDRFSSEQLVADLKSRGKQAHYFENTEAIIAFIFEHAKPNDLILIMSNGGFDQIHEKLIQKLN